MKGTRTKNKNNNKTASALSNSLGNLNPSDLAKAMQSLRYSHPSPTTTTTASSLNNTMMSCNNNNNDRRCACPKHRKLLFDSENNNDATARFNDTVGSDAVLQDDFYNQQSNNAKRDKNLLPPLEDQTEMVPLLIVHGENNHRFNIGLYQPLRKLSHDIQNVFGICPPSQVLTYNRELMNPHLSLHDNGALLLKGEAYVKLMLEASKGRHAALQVVFPNGKALPVSIREDAKGRDLKHLILEAASHPDAGVGQWSPDNIRLWYNSTEVKENAELSYYHLTNHAKIVVARRPDHSEGGGGGGSGRYSTRESIKDQQGYYGGGGGSGMATAASHRDARAANVNNHGTFRPSIRQMQKMELDRQREESGEARRRLQPGKRIEPTTSSTSNVIASYASNSRTSPGKQRATSADTRNKRYDVYSTRSSGVSGAKTTVTERVPSPGATKIRYTADNRQPAYYESEHQLEKETDKALDNLSVQIQKLEKQMHGGPEETDKKRPTSRSGGASSRPTSAGGAATPGGRKIVYDNEEDRLKGELLESNEKLNVALQRIDELEQTVVRYQQLLHKCSMAMGSGGGGVGGQHPAAMMMGMGGVPQQQQMLFGGAPMSGGAMMPPF